MSTNMRLFVSRHRFTACRLTYRIRTVEQARVGQ